MIEGGYSSPLLDVLLGGTDDGDRGSKVALVESANCFRLESSNDGVEDTAVVEDNEILGTPMEQSANVLEPRQRTYQSCG